MNSIVNMGEEWAVFDSKSTYLREPFLNVHIYESPRDRRRCSWRLTLILKGKGLWLLFFGAGELDFSNKGV